MSESVAKLEPRGAARDPWLGRVLLERYRIQHRIGKGGMGVVYLAEHVLLRKRVAIKTLSADALSSPEAAQRFLREAQAAAAVGNEHIVDVTDMGELDTGELFFVLEYLDGVDLGFEVAARGPLPVARAVALLEQLCEAMAAVHAAGVVHRDLKPDNLFVVQRGDADFLKVLDFGVCKMHERAEDARALTHTGVTLGTPNYMAPEQVQGARHVDHRVDVYGIGAIAYYLLLGEPPFDAPVLPKLFMRICHDPPDRVHVRRPEVPAALGRVIDRALAKDPEARFADCEALRVALHRALSDQGLPTQSASDGRDRASDVHAVSGAAATWPEGVVAAPASPGAGETTASAPSTRPAPAANGVTLSRAPTVALRVRPAGAGTLRSAGALVRSFVLHQRRRKLRSALVLSALFALLSLWGMQLGGGAQGRAVAASVSLPPLLVVARSARAPGPAASQVEASQVEASQAEASQAEASQAEASVDINAATMDPRSASRRALAAARKRPAAAPAPSAAQRPRAPQAAPARTPALDQPNKGRQPAGVQGLLPPAPADGPVPTATASPPAAAPASSPVSAPSSPTAPAALDSSEYQPSARGLRSVF